MCPFCRRFELSAGSALADLVAGQLASIAYHPLNFLDQASTTNYSTRAAAVSGCAADRGQSPATRMRCSSTSHLRAARG
jgi:protein-disulfide isomerase